MTTGQSPDRKMASATAVVSCRQGYHSTAAVQSKQRHSLLRVSVTESVRPASDGVSCLVRVTSW